MDILLQQAVTETRAWITRAVVGLNLCPFARVVQAKNQIRCVATDAVDAETLLARLCDEMHFLAETDPVQTDTTLLVHPHAMTDFLDFNDFLEIADAALEELGYAGVLQVAPFHPQFQFADSALEDIGNATNRSPYPTLHLLREDSVERAVAAFPEADAIFNANIRTLEQLGPQGWAELQAQCRADAHTGDR